MILIRKIFQLRVNCLRDETAIYKQTKTKESPR